MDRLVPRVPRAAWLGRARAAAGRPLMRWRMGTVVPATILAALCAAAVLAPFLTPFADQGLGAANIETRLLPPSWEHPFGTDELGRDLLARALFGLRSTLIIGLVVVVVGAIIGTAVGVVAGYVGGWVDELIMRSTDVLLAFPALLLAITLAMVFGPSTLSAIVAISLTWWLWYARIARAAAISLREQNFVRAARAMGVPGLRIIGRHVVPNVIIPIRVLATQDIGAAILAGAALGFLGLGTQPPDADLGRMVNDGRLGLLSGQWWLIFFPGALIYLTVLGAISLSDSFEASTERGA